MARATGATYSATLATTSETDTVTIYASGAGQRGATFFVSSTAQAGTAKIYFINHSGDSKLIHSQAVAASATDATAIDIDFNLPKAKLAWVGGGTTSTVVTVEGVSY